MAKQRKEPAKHRNAVALSMILARKRTTVMKDRRAPRGGARNHERDFMQEAVDAASPWPKTCVVCDTKYDKREWLELPCIGVMKSDNLAEFPDHELRNCPCRNTLSMSLPLPE